METGPLRLSEIDLWFCSGTMEIEARSKSRHHPESSDHVNLTVNNRIFIGTRGYCEVADGEILPKEV